MTKEIRKLNKFENHAKRVSKVQEYDALEKIGRSSEKGMEVFRRKPFYLQKGNDAK